MPPIAILCVLAAAFFNAAWSAVSKRALAEFPADVFTLLMRFGTAIFLFPFFLWRFETHLSASFWLWLAAAGLLETVAIVLQSAGVRRDYYSTFSLVNITPLFVLAFAPGMLGERLSPALVAGVLLVAAGAVFFFPGGKFHHGAFGILAAALFALNNVASKLAITEANPYFFSFPTVLLGVVLFAPVTLIRRLRSPRIADAANDISRARTSETPEIATSPRREMLSIRGISRRAWIALSATAFCSFLSTLLFYLAIGFGDVTRASSLVRTNLIFGFFLSFYFLHERYGWRRKLLAGLLIFAGTLLVTLAKS